MNSYFSSLLLPVLAAVSLGFLTVRLHLLTEEGRVGRAPFIIGSLLIITAATWQTVSGIPGYPFWFLPSVYPWLDLVQLLCLITGVLLIVVGLSLHSDFWQTRGEQIAARDRRLSVLTNLQRDARQPYQLVELLDIALKEVVSELPECAGAVFLLNRSRRQLVLTASLALDRKETALMERYPLGQNIVSQVIDIGEPLIGGQFVFYEQSGAAVQSRFQSTLVLPLVSGAEKIGAVVLLSGESRFFSGTEIRFLSPVTEWLAEKIRSARLNRDLSAERNAGEALRKRQAEMTAHLVQAMEAISASDAIPAFCRSLVGLYDSGSVHVIGLVGGELEFYGGSEPLLDLTENYKIALIDALDRGRPLIINQEAVGEDDRSYVAHSTLLYPVDGKGRRDAIVFRRESGAFQITEGDLKTAEVLARVAVAALAQTETTRLDITRRKGIRQVLRLLRFEDDSGAESGTASLVDHLSELLPPRAAVLTFERQPNGSLRADRGSPSETGDLRGFELGPGEGFIGEAVQSGESVTVYGRVDVNRAIQGLQASNRDALLRYLGEAGQPVLLIASPIAGRDRISGIVVACIYDITESEKGEWERFITLSVGLYSLRRVVAELRQTQTPALPDTIKGGDIGGIVNRLNNHFSAVIANAELAAGRQDLQGEVRSHFTSIIAEVELAAEYVRTSLGRLVDQDSEPEPGPADVGAAVRQFLDRTHISENLHMLGGRPREVQVRLHASEAVACAPTVVQTLVAETLSRLAPLADEDEIMTVAVYQFGSSVYMDASRHRKALPAVERVATFGQYRLPNETARARTDGGYLSQIVGPPCQFCDDQSGQKPAFLSVKFPVYDSSAAVTPVDRKAFRILVIDDQTVILDLVTAMCRSLGYDVSTAKSGEEGLRVFEETDIDIVLTDLAMPGMSGLDVARRVRDLNPDLPVILVTGWEVTLQPGQLESAGVAGLLHKPFRIEQLTDIIRSAARARSAI